MQIEFGPALFACGGPGAGTVIATNILLSQALAVVTGLIAYDSLRRWSLSEGPALCPAACGILLLLHPAWTVSAIHGDCGGEKLLDSVLATVIAGTFALTQSTRRRPRTVGDAPPGRPTGTGDTRIFAGESFNAVRVADGSPLPGDLPILEPPNGTDRLQVLKVANRLLALVPVGLFAYAQYGWYSRAVSGGSKPNWALGPLYFLVNASSADDWIGYALLTVAVPCLLAVVVRPNRLTALAASLTAWAWVIPGTVKVLAVQ